MQKFLRELKKFYKTHQRLHLPWRGTHDPYKILVSEIMLQQTQVERVIPFYNTFIKKFPNASALAKAPLSEVLKIWSGLGYNRRAKFLHEAGKKIYAETLRSGEMSGSPTPARRVSASKFSTTFLQSLPGVGKYTAGAISAFAYNRTEVFIETNIRTAFLYHYCDFSRAGQTCADVPRRFDLRKISDAEILPLIAKALKKSKMQPRDFYAALMDYGTYLKRSGIKLNNKSKHYSKQTKFEGSARQLRGAILRELLKGPKTLTDIVKITGRTKEEAARILARLASEGLIKKQGSCFSILD